MITGLLSIIFCLCLFYGIVKIEILIFLCIILGILLTLSNRHKHTQFFTFDVLAQTSRLNKIDATIKFWQIVILMVISVSASSPIIGIFLVVIACILIVNIGGLSLQKYVQLLLIPISFLMLSGISLLFEVNSQPTGILNINIFGFWFCVSKISQLRTSLVIARSLGAVSCLYLLSLTTPMSDIIGVLRRSHCPDIIIDLMYLTYRYIFILLSMYHTMQNAAKSRLGYSNYKNCIRTTGNIYSNLLARSYRQANKNFDAMESRCFDTQIRFIEKRVNITFVQAAFCISITILTLTLSLIFS